MEEADNGTKLQHGNNQIYPSGAAQFSMAASNTQPKNHLSHNILTCSNHEGDNKVKINTAMVGMNIINASECVTS